MSRWAGIPVVTVCADALLDVGTVGLGFCFSSSLLLVCWEREGLDLDWSHGLKEPPLGHCGRARTGFTAPAGYG